MTKLTIWVSGNKANYEQDMPKMTNYKTFQTYDLLSHQCNIHGYKVSEHHS